jgi:hypothetical protein
MAVFWDVISHDQFTILMMEAEVSSVTLVHVYQSAHCLPGDIILIEIDKEIIKQQVSVN